MKRIRKILSLILTSLLSIFLLCNLYLLSQKMIFKTIQPTIFGYSNAIVISGSMSGNIEINDMVICHSKDEYEVGDIISFVSGNHLVTHRIIRQEKDGFITKGDANNAEDLEVVSKEQIVGKVIYVVPVIGSFISYIQSPLGMSILLFLGYGLIFIPKFIEEKKRRNKT